MKLENIFPTARKESFFIIPPGMMVTGSLNTRIPGQISGMINGNVFAKTKIVIQKEGVINGDVAAEELLVYGKINGDIQCTGKIIVQDGAVIKGNIITAEIHIDKDAWVEGTVTKLVTEEPGIPAPVIEEKFETTETLIEVPEQKILIREEEIKRHAWF